MARPRGSPRGARSIRLPTGSAPASSVAGASAPITPKAMMTRCSTVDFLGWVRRIFTADGSQVLDLQRDALLAAEVARDRCYEDVASGRYDARPGLEACLKALRPG